MKRLTLFILLFVSFALATSKDNFVLNILKDGNPVREINGVAVIPFESEYEILIKNDNNRRCVAKVTIDGTDVSSFGEFIINAKGELNLERFVTESLTEGKRFKFVPLDNPAVDDPTRKGNGIVRVELKLEKKYESIKIAPYPYYWWDADSIILSDGEVLDIISGSTNLNIITLDNANVNITTSDEVIGLDITNYTLCSGSMPGATIAGSLSGQRFYEVDFDAEDKTVVLELKIMGVE